MNKNDLITKISEDANISKKEADAALKSFVSAVTNELANGGKIQLIGFGTFSTTERAARTGHNPSTGESIQIKACTLPKFKPGQALKDAVNK